MLLTIILICIGMIALDVGADPVRDPLRERNEMYVCICNAITDKQIRAAAEEGTTDLFGLQAKLGVATGCGSCGEVASEILAEFRAAAEPAREYIGPKIYTPAIA